MDQATYVGMFIFTVVTLSGLLAVFAKIVTAFANAVAKLDNLIQKFELSDATNRREHEDLYNRLDEHTEMIKDAQWFCKFQHPEQPRKI